MTTEQALSLKESITRKLDYSDKNHRESLERNKKGRWLLEETVLPHMPRTLGEYFTPNYVSVMHSSFSKTMQLHVDFNPRNAEYDTALVLGTMRKVSDGLQSGGWTITSDLEAVLTGSTLTITIEATLNEMPELPRSWGTGFFRKPEDTIKKISLVMSFERIKETENCRLVEKEVTVPATEEHKEKRTTLVCDEVTDGRVAV